MLIMSTVEIPLARHRGESDLPWVSLGDGSDLRLLQCDVEAGLWVIRTRFSPGYLVQTHKHTGEVFAFIYFGVFVAIDHNGWWLGALFGLLHGIVSSSALITQLLPVIHPRMGTPLSAADSNPLIEPPGFLVLNYGRRTPLVTLLAHVAYGAIVGGFVSLAS